MNWDGPTSWCVATGRFAATGPWCAVPLPSAGGMRHIGQESSMLAPKCSRLLHLRKHQILDDEPLLFHTGPRKMFPLVREAVESLIPVGSLRFIALSHFEADEWGSLNEWLACAPQ